MEARECIRNRRSVRKFDEREVPVELIREIVADAAYAPSWKNTQPTRYIAVLDGSVREKIASECVMDFAWNQKIIEGAPALVVVTTVDKRSGYERDGSESTSKGSHWQSFDAGSAAEAFCLSAHAQGLGTVILGVFDEEKVREALQIPEGELVSALIPVGYPAEEPKAPKRKPVDELVRVIG